MTYEEAIKDLQINCESLCYKKFEDCIEDCEVKVAIEALNKQIPKKVNWIYGRDMGISHCPVCDREVHIYMNGCPYCLQAIDWSEEE